MTTLADMLIEISFRDRGLQTLSSMLDGTVLNVGHGLRVGADNGAFIEQMNNSVRYVVRREVDEIAIQLIEDIGFAGVPMPQPPLEDTWLELNEEGVRVGLLLRTTGFGMLILNSGADSWLTAGVQHDFPNDMKLIPIAWSKPTIKKTMELVLARMVVIFQLIQSPRLLEQREYVHGEKLQRSREKRGRAPLVSFREVTVHVTRRERDAQAAAEEHERRTGKRLHHVRAFYRVKRGKVERVSAHWRGSAELGVVHATGHRVIR